MIPTKTHRGGFNEPSISPTGRVQLRKMLIALEQHGVF